MHNFRKIFFGFLLLTYAAFTALFGWFSVVAAPSADNREAPGVVVPVYWDEAEPERLEYDFSLAAARVAELDSRGLGATITLGFKLPSQNEGLPECVFPVWYDHEANQATKDKHLFQMMRSAVTHFRDNPAVVAWKVEDDALHPSDGCPPADEGLLRAEETLVRELNNNDLPVYVEYHRPATLPVFWDWLSGKITNGLAR